MKIDIRHARCPKGVRSLEELAAQQGVTPIDDFDALLGKPSLEDESVDEIHVCCAVGAAKRHSVDAHALCGSLPQRRGVNVFQIPRR